MMWSSGEENESARRSLTEQRLRQGVFENASKPFASGDAPGRRNSDGEFAEIYESSEEAYLLGAAEDLTVALIGKATELR